MSRLAATAPAMPSANTGQSQSVSRTIISGTGTKSGTVRTSVQMSPSDEPSAPMTNVLRRNNPSAAIVPIRQKRSHCWSIATNSKTSAEGDSRS